jgi:hypothetical protein
VGDDGFERMGDFKGLDVLTRARRTGGRLKAGSVFGLPYVAEQPQGCHNIDLRLLVQARLADEAKIVLRNFRCSANEQMVRR